MSDVLAATHFQARMPDTSAHRRVLAKAAYGDTDVAIGDEVCDVASGVLVRALHEHGVKPIPRSLRLGWPRRAIAEGRIIIVDVLAVSDGIDTNVFTSFTGTRHGDGAEPRPRHDPAFHHRGMSGTHGIASNNTHAVMPDTAPGSMIATRLYEGRMAVNSFALSDIAAFYTIADTRDEPIIDCTGAARGLWSSGAMHAPALAAGTDLNYDLDHARPLFSTARLDLKPRGRD